MRTTTFPIFIFENNGLEETLNLEAYKYVRMWVKGGVTHYECYYDIKRWLKGDPPNLSFYLNSGKEDVVVTNLKEINTHD